MAEISAALVKQLRDRTGAGMMECKKALVEAKGDVSEAETVLRKWGIASAGKKATRSTKQGTIGTYIHAGAQLGVGDFPASLGLADHVGKIVLQRNARHGREPRGHRLCRNPKTTGTASIRLFAQRGAQPEQDDDDQHEPPKQTEAERGHLGKGKHPAK